MDTPGGLGGAGLAICRCQQQVRGAGSHRGPDVTCVLCPCAHCRATQGAMPFIIFGIASLVAGAAIFTLPETLGTRLPDTMQGERPLCIP